MTGAGKSSTAAVFRIAAALVMLTLLANCAPLVGAAAVVGADQVAEQDGDQGLF